MGHVSSRSKVHIITEFVSGSQLPATRPSFFTSTEYGLFSLSMLPAFGKSNFSSVSFAKWLSVKLESWVRILRQLRFQRIRHKAREGGDSPHKSL